MIRLKHLSIALFIVSLAVFCIFNLRSRDQKNHEAPILTVESEQIEVSIHDPEEALLQGVSATDSEDGDLSNTVIVESIGRFKPDNRRTITYAVVDSDGLVAHAQRKLVYSDYTPIRFSMDRALSFGAGSVNLVEGITAEDCLDGDVSDTIRLISEEGVDVLYPGKYEAELKAVNSAGAQTTIPVTVEIYDTNLHSGQPKINLNEYMVYIPAGTKFDPRDYLDTVSIKGIEYSFTNEEESYETSDLVETADENTINVERVQIQNDVNPDVPGCYEVLYIISDEENVKGMTTLVVVVTEGGNE